MAEMLKSEFDVFISYARDDNSSGAVAELDKQLTHAGKNVWIDFEAIKPGDDFIRVFIEGLDKCDVVLAILSSRYMKRENCLAELNRAIENKKRIIPIVIEQPFDFTAFNQLAGNRNAIFATNFQPLQFPIDEIVKALDADPEYDREHTRLLLRARNWKENNGNTLSGSELQKAETWLDHNLNRTENPPSPLHIEYIRASWQARNRFLQVVAAISVVAAIVFLIVGIFAVIQANLANRRALESQSLSLAASAQQALSGNNVDLAIPLALAANNIDNPPVRSQDALAAASYAFGTRLRLEGHHFPVTGVAYTPDGKHALSGGWDSQIIYWDLETGQIIFQTDVPNKVLAKTPVYSLSVSPDGQLALVAGTDHVIHIFDLNTKQFTGELTGHSQPVEAVTYSTDGKYAASAGHDQTVILWDMAKRGALKVYKGHKAIIRAVAISPDDQYVISGDDSGNIILWGLQQETEIRRFTQQQDGISTLRFSPDGQAVLSGDSSGKIILWDVGTGLEKMPFNGEQNSILSVAFSPDGTSIISAGRSQKIIRWDVQTGRPITTYIGHTGSVNTVAFSPDGKTILSGSDDDTVRLWQAQNLSEINRFSNRHASITSMMLSADGNRILSSATNGTILLQDRQSGIVIQSFSGHTELVTALGFAADEHQIISGSWDGSLRLWDIPSGKQLQQFQAKSGFQVTNLVLNKSASTAVFIINNPDTTEYHIFVWDVPRWQQIKEIKLPNSNDSPFGLAFSPNGQSLLIGTLTFGSDSQLNETGAIVQWDLTTDQQIHRLEGHSAAVTELAFTSDGLYAASGSNDQTAKLWNLQTGELVRTFSGITNQVHAVAVSPDNKYLVSGAADGSIILWDIQTGTNILRYEGHLTQINNLAFTPDNRYLLSGSRDGTIREWLLPLPLDPLMASIHMNHYVRDFTCDERVQYSIQPLCDANGVFPTQTPYPTQPSTLIPAAVNNTPVITYQPAPTFTAVPSPTPIPTATIEVTATASITPSNTGKTPVDAARIAQVTSNLPFTAFVPASPIGFILTDINLEDKPTNAENTFGPIEGKILTMRLSANDHDVGILQFKAAFANVDDWALKVRGATRETTDKVTFISLLAMDEVAILLTQDQLGVVYIYKDVFTVVSGFKDLNELQLVMASMLPEQTEIYLQTASAPNQTASNSQIQTAIAKVDFTVFVPRSVSGLFINSIAALDVEPFAVDALTGAKGLVLYTVWSNGSEKVDVLQVKSVYTDIHSWAQTVFGSSVAVGSVLQYQTIKGVEVAVIDTSQLTGTNGRFYVFIKDGTLVDASSNSFPTNEFEALINALVSS